MINDVLSVLMREFNYCEMRYKPEMVDGMRVGLMLAFESAKAGKPFSRELHGYLLRLNSQVISLKELKSVLFEIPDIQVTEAVFACSFLNFEDNSLNSRRDFVIGFKSVYEISMQAFLEIINFSRDPRVFEVDLKIYFDAMMTLVVGLERKILELSVIVAR